MRAPGIAAIVLGAVIALSGTLGVTYRSEAAPLEDPGTSVASDSSPPAADAPTTDATTPVTSDATTPTDTATPSESASPTDTSTPSDDATPSDDPTPTFSSEPTDAGTPDDAFPPAFHTFGFQAFDAENPQYSFKDSNSVHAEFDLAEGAITGDIEYVGTDPETGEDGAQLAQVCAVDSDTTHASCDLDFSSNPGSGLWHLTADQNGEGAPSPQDAYVYIPPAPTLDDVNEVEGWQIHGTGIPGDTVEVLDSSDEVVCGPTTVDAGEGGDEWYCDPDEGFNGNDSFTAVQTDAGDNNADGVLYTIPILAGGISLPSAEFDNRSQSSLPTVTYDFFPGGIVVHAAPTGRATIVDGEIDGWDPTDPESSFPTLALCPPSAGDEGTPVAGPVDCSFTAPGPGLYNPYIAQRTANGEDGDRVDDYFSVPVTPSISRATAESGGRVIVTGSGVATDGIRVIVDGSTVTCSGTMVSSAGTWSCTLGPLSKGTHSFQAYDVDLGAGRDAQIEEGGEGLPGDSDIRYMTGGLSALSPGVSVKVTSSSIAATPTPTATPTDFSDWFFTITGVDLNNVHPGDTFTVTGTGLPPGATISGELHSKAVSIGSAAVGPDGTFVLPVVVPADFPAGAHTIVMTLTPAGGAPAVSQQPLTVVAAAASSGSGDPSPSPTPDDNSSQIEGAEGPGIDNHGPNSNILTHGLNSIADVLAHPAKVPAAIEIGLVLLIFAVLPGHLLNATLAEQYERFNERRPKRRRPVSAWLARVAAFLHRAPFVAGLALTTVTALLFGFADPRFGFSLASLRLFLGLAIALAIVSYLVNALTGLIMRGRWRVDVEVNLRPLGLVLTVVGVVVSRVLDFSPGFLIGLVLGLVISEKHLAKHAWRAVLLRTGLLLGLALLAWLAFSLFDAKEEGGTFASELAVETLVAITTEAVVGLLVELLPLRLLEGEKLYQKSKVLWGALYLVAVFIFVVAVVPWEGNWAELGNSLWAWIGIVVGFGILATAIYIFFRVRSREEVDHHIDKDEDGDELVPIGSEDDER
ncbi:MAG TPA: hypothetical protein VGM70_07605 [Pseudolysinimonas sp.]